MSKIKTSVAALAILFGVAVASSALAAGGHGGGRGGGGHGGHGWHGGHGYSHSSVRIGVGFGGPYWWGYPYYAPYYGYAPYYPAYPAYPAAYPYAAPYAAGPAEYVEQAPPPGASAPRAGGYWYYCNESQASYPHVNQCAGPWQRVPAQPPAG